MASEEQKPSTSEASASSASTGTATAAEGADEKASEAVQKAKTSLPTQPTLDLARLSPSEAPEDDVDDETALLPTDSAGQAVMQVLRLAGPGLFSCIMALLMECCNTLLIARHGTAQELAALGIGNLLVNFGALSFALGICGALDTFVSQAHGARNYQLVAKYFDQCKFTLVIQMVFCIGVFWISEYLLRGLGMPHTVAQAAGKYARHCSCGIFQLYSTLAMGALLRNQLQILVPSMIAIVCTLLHIVPAVLLIAVQGRGLDGAAWANVITWSTQFLLLCGFLLKVSPELKQTRLRFFLFERRSLNGLVMYFHVCIPAILIVGGEWWFWELTQLVAGRIGPSALAANVAMANFMMLTAPVTNALTGAAAALVGRSIGEHAKDKAMRYLRIAILLNLLCWTIVSIVVTSQKRPLAEFYARDHEHMADIIENCLGILVFFGPMDSTRIVLSGILRGCGMQSTCGTVIAMVHYALVFPMALVLCFPFHFGLQGLWYSFLIGAEVAVIALSYVIFKSDMKPEFPAADIRTAHHKLG